MLFLLVDCGPEERGGATDVPGLVYLYTIIVLYSLKLFCLFVCVFFVNDWLKSTLKLNFIQTPLCACVTHSFVHLSVWIHPSIQYSPQDSWLAYSLQPSESVCSLDPRPRQVRPPGCFSVFAAALLERQLVREQNGACLSDYLKALAPSCTLYLLLQHNCLHNGFSWASAGCQFFSRTFHQ